MSARRFRHRPDAEPGLVARVRSRALWFTAGGFAVAALAALRAAANASSFLQDPNAVGIPAGICVLGLVLGGAGVRALLRANDVVRSFELALEAGALTRSGGGLPALTLSRAEVSRIVAVGGELAVLGRDPRQAIGIPATLEGFEDLRAVLETWAVPEPLSAARDVVGRSAKALAWHQLDRVRRSLVLGAVLIALYLVFRAAFSP